MKRFFEIALTSILLTTSLALARPAFSCDEPPVSEFPAGIVDTGVGYQGSAEVSLKSPGPNSFLNVRTAPNTQSAIVGKLQHKTKVNTFRKQGDWYLIKTIGEDRAIGWVDGRFLSNFGEIIN